MRLRSLILIMMTVLIGLVGQARGVQEEEESLGAKVKNFFTQPTPKPRKRHKASPTPQKTPSPKASPTAKKKRYASPTASPKASASSSPEASVAPSASATPSPTETPEAAAGTPTPEKASPTPSSTRGKTKKRLSEPVRPISPGPRRKHLKSPPPGASISPADEEPSPAETPRAESKASATPATVSDGKGTRGPIATISAGEIAGYEKYPANVQKVLDVAIGLTTQNLGYKYGSADPASGGMDCSGFIHYVLSKSGLTDVPRDAREQYIWVRKAGTFQAVLGHSDDTFELDALKPGDLLFWSGTYHVDRDPSITHTMIYLGREKANNQRIMVGASDGRTYKGQSRFGVSVFDFKVSHLAPKADGLSPVFVGYGRVPGLKDE